jgi:hypothetical protein
MCVCVCVGGGGGARYGKLARCLEEGGVQLGSPANQHRMRWCAAEQQDAAELAGQVVRGRLGLAASVASLALPLGPVLSAPHPLCRAVPGRSPARRS